MEQLLNSLHPVVCITGLSHIFLAHICDIICNFVSELRFTFTSVCSILYKFISVKALKELINQNRINKDVFEENLHYVHRKYHKQDSLNSAVNHHHHSSYWVGRIIYKITY